MNPILGAIIVPIATYALSVLWIIAVICYAVFRLKSTHIIREKIWSSFVGDRDFSDERLKSFSDEQLDLSRFRVIYGVSARSLSDLHRLLTWMSKHGLIPIDVKRARSWIDPSREEPLETPKLKFAVTWLLIFMMLLVSLFATMRAIDSNETLLKMRVSGTWYWSDGNAAYPVRGHWRLDRGTCTKGPTPDTSVTHLSAAETKLLCDGIGNGELQTFVKDAIKAQRRLFALMILSIVFLGATAFLKIDSAGHANRLAKKLGATADQELPLELRQD